MEGMLTLGAINAILGNADDLFPRGKNIYYADFLGGKPREYFNWDLDTVISFAAVHYDIYTTVNGGNQEYTNIILGHPDFRRRYNEILVELISGPLAPTALNAFLDTLEPILAPELLADSDNNMPEGVTDYFDSLRQWTIDRTANVCAQVAAEYPDLVCGTSELPLVGDMNGDGTVDARDASLLVLSLVDRTAFDAAYPLVDAGTIGDVNGDGQLDAGDLSGLGPLYAGSAAASAVPEPGSVTLVMLAAAGLLCSRRASRLRRAD